MSSASEGEEHGVNVNESPTMFGCVRLYMEAAALTGATFSPPHGRDRTLNFTIVKVNMLIAANSECTPDS